MPLTDIRTCPTFVVNLDRRPDRWKQFSAQSTVADFSQLKRFSAVDGSKLDVLNDKRIAPGTRQNIMRKYRRSDYEINTPGAIGATLSHSTIWREFLKTDAEYVVVFEDDTMILPKDMARVDKLIRSLPADWDMWLLGTHTWNCVSLPLTSDWDSWHKVKQFTGAHAYVLNRRGAELLLEEIFPIDTHIEYYISSMANLKGLKLIKHPSLCISYFSAAEEEGDSDTFDSFLSCPVCMIPDTFMNTGLYIPGDILTRGLIASAALAFVGAGYFLSRR